MDAHTGRVEKSWNDMQSKKIKGVIGNRNTRKKVVDMEVEKIKKGPCIHEDAERRIVVSYSNN